MAYENQNKCEGCGISIPAVSEDADIDARLCDTCYVDKKLYNVHLYAVARVKVTDVPADSQREAIGKALDMVELDRLFRDTNLRGLYGAADVEDAEEINEALVDEVGDEEYRNSRFHNLRASQYSREIADWHGRFDAIEIHKCAEIYNSVSDEFYVEQYDDDEDPLVTGVDEVVTKKFYGIYGHLREGGLISLCDCNDEADANAVAAALRSFQ